MNSSLTPTAKLELHSRIVSPSVSETLDYLLMELDGFGIFEFVPNVRGKKKAVMFRVGVSSPFAVIANNMWLLWYFRRPGVNSGLFSFKELARLLPEFNETNRKDPEKTEGTIKLYSRSDVDSLIGYIRSIQPRFRA